MNNRTLQLSVVRPQLQSIGNYIINPAQLVGQGSFSRIYKGTDKRTGQPVAVKVIDLAMIEANGLRKFLDREVKINAMVEHSYVLKCYEISYTASNCFLVTEICPEGDLQRYIKQRGKLSEEEALRLLKQLVVGLRYLHSRQILHRDLKSSNVFLKNGQVRIADFGLSHSFSSGGVQEKVLIGTPAYMAPETLISNDYSYKCDVWALGNIFVEMLTGKAPFMNSMTIDQLKGLFLGGVRLRLDNISGRSCQLVDSMLKIRKQDRISVQQLYDKLCCDGEEVLSQRTQSSLKWNIKSSRTEPSEGDDPKVRLLEYLLFSVKEFQLEKMLELVQLVVLFAKAVVREEYDSLNNTWELQRLLKAIIRYQNPRVSVRNNLDLDYFMYYLQHTEEELRATYRQLADHLAELLQLVHAFQQGKLSRVRWHDEEPSEPLTLCSPNLSIARRRNPAQRT